MRSGFRKFIKAIGGDMLVGAITKEHGRTYKEIMMAKGLAASTVNKYLYGVAHCLTWAQAQGFLPETWTNPIKGLKLSKRVVKSQRTQTVPFTDEEFIGWKRRHPEYYYGVRCLTWTFYSAGGCGDFAGCGAANKKILLLSSPCDV
jgi:hypothetical protein